MEAGSDRAHTKWIGVAQTQLAIPPGTIQLVNRLSFILARLSTKRACIRLLDSFPHRDRNGFPELWAHVSASRWHSDYIKHFTQTGAVTEEEALYCKYSHFSYKKAVNPKWFVIITLFSFVVVIMSWRKQTVLNWRFKTHLSLLFLLCFLPWVSVNDFNYKTLNW